jgi:hypothetical protein
MSTRSFRAVRRLASNPCTLRAYFGHITYGSFGRFFKGIGLRRLFPAFTRVHRAFCAAAIFLRAAAHLTFFPMVALLLVIFYAAGLVGWAILFALHRSGVHRLADMTTEQK